MPKKNSNTNTQLDKLRIDKWLWTARFFKTRQLASTAIKGGKIKFLSGTTSKRAKPASDVHIGDKLEIQRGPYQHVIEGLGIHSHRGSATIAQTLYSETNDSLQRREEVAEQLRNQPHNPWGGRKPDKRTVRQNRNIKRQL